MRAPQNQEIFLKNSHLKKNATFWSFSKIYHQILDFNFVIFCDFEDFESQILEFCDSGNNIKTELKSRGGAFNFPSKTLVWAPSYTNIDYLISPSFEENK